MAIRKTTALFLILLPSVIFAQQSLTVLTINVWSGLDYEGVWKMGEYETEARRNQRYKILVSEFKELSPDVICLQEVNPVPDYARKLASEIGYTAYGFVGMGGIRVGPIGLPVNYREGDAILVKPGFEVESLGRIQLSGAGFSTNWVTFHFEEINQVMGVRISRDGDTVDVYNTHLHAGPDYATGLRDKLRALWKSRKISTAEFTSLRDRFQTHQDRRMQEIGRAARFIYGHSRDGFPVIFAGDFNFTPNSGEADELASLGFIDTYKQVGQKPMYTWNPMENTNIREHYHRPAPDASVAEKIRWEADMTTRRIDYVWYKPNDGQLEIRKVGLFGDRAQNGVYPSDHFGYYAVMRLE